MNDNVLTMLIIFNGVINLIILWVVAPIFRLRGTLDQIEATIIHHENRLLSIEERI